MKQRLKQLMGSESTRAKAARGGAILAVATVFERGLRLVRTMILTRILAPDEFGLMAYVLLVNALFEAMTDVGVRQAVIQNKRGNTEAFLNIAWWFNAGRGLVIYAMGFAATPWICDFYEKPELEALLRVSLLAFVFASLVSTRMFVLQKELRIAPFVSIQQGAGLASTIITLVCVLFIPNVWALVIGFVAETFLRALISFVLVPIRPTLHFDRELASEFFTFARRMALLGLVAFLVSRADVFVLGKVLTEAELGLYTLAMMLADMPRFGISRVVGPLLLPVLAKVQDDLVALKREFLGLTRTLLALIIPLATGLIVFSGPILRVVWGERYGAMSLTFKILCVYLMIAILARTIMSVYMAVGRPDYQRRAAFLRLFLLACTMYPAVQAWVTVGAALSCLVSLLVTFAGQIIHLRKIIGLGTLEYVQSAGVGLGLGLVVGLPGVVVIQYCGASDLLATACFAVLMAVAWGSGGWRMLKKARLATRASQTSVAGTE